MLNRFFGKWIFLAALAPLLLLNGCVCCGPVYGRPVCVTYTESANHDPESAVRAATERFAYALNALFAGDAVPMEEVWSHADAVSLMTPFGGHLVGWPALRAQFVRESEMGLVGRVAWHDVVINVDRGAGLAFIAGYLSGHLTMKNGQPGMVNERVTAIWEREEGRWKLVQLHADLIPEMEAGLSVKNKDFPRLNLR